MLRTCRRYSGLTGPSMNAVSIHLPGLIAIAYSCRLLVDDLDTTGTQGGKAYTTFGVEPSGAVVVVRPDGYVGAISPFDSISHLNRFFSSIMASL